MNHFALSSLRGAALPVLVSALLLPAAGMVHAGPWTAIVSTCESDDDSGARRSFYGVSVSSVALPRTVRLRCNVTDTFGRGGVAATPMRFGARFADNGADASVQLRLWEHNFATGALRSVMAINSDTLPAVPALKTQWNYGGCAIGLDFRRNAYWVEATLTRRSLAGTPSLHQLRIEDAVLC